MVSLSHSERGKLGAASRWRNPANRRAVRLDDLTLSQKAIVLALIDAARCETAASEAAPQIAEAAADEVAEARQ